MEVQKAIDNELIKDLVSKNWVTHDAIWYGLCLHKLGKQQTNQLNKSAIRMMAGIEIKRFMVLFGKPLSKKIQTFHELKTLLEGAFQIIQTSFMTFKFSFPKMNMLVCEFNDCYTFKRLEKFGMIDTYECSFIERVKGWLDRLSIKYVIRPYFNGCLMYEEGKCSIEFQFDLK